MKNKNVLIVDDDDDFINLVKKACENYNVDCISVNSPSDGFNELVSGKYDVAFIDWRFDNLKTTGEEIINFASMNRIGTKVYVVTNYDIDRIKEKTGLAIDNIEEIVPKSETLDLIKRVLG